jgi:hypothetical protein
LFRRWLHKRNFFRSADTPLCSWEYRAALVIETRLRGLMLALLAATRQPFNPKASLSCGRQDDFTGKGNSADAANFAAADCT